MSNPLPILRASQSYQSEHRQIIICEVKEHSTVWRYLESEERFETPTVHLREALRYWKIFPVPLSPDFKPSRHFVMSTS